MKIKHSEIDVNEQNPFANCKLERKQYADVLSDVVKTCTDGFVLAINNEWGTGKTTFVKMWQQALRNDGFQTVYFNAWENDFESNPIIAIMSELQSLTNDKNGEIFKTVVEKGAILTKHILPALVKSVAKKYIDVDEITDAIGNLTKGTTEIFEKEINEYATKKKTVVEFRKELEKFIKKAETGKPLVFIIDELDRCRPDYAVEVLEQVKHFFSVQGIVFVLSIDKKHLASSIKGYYGSENIDTDEYLRRFIDLEYSIPKPTTELFCEYLYDYYSFDDFFSSNERMYYKNSTYDKENFLTISEQLFNQSNATLRQQEKMFALTRLILLSFDSRERTFSHLLFVLVYIKTMKNELYEAIKNNVYSLQELCNILDDLLPFKYDNSSSLYIQALFLQFYNNNREYYMNQEKTLDTNERGHRIGFIKSKFETVSDKLTTYFEQIDKSDWRDLDLNYLLKRIDLISPMNKRTILSQKIKHKNSRQYD